jgi:hypothetical protein
MGWVAGDATWTAGELVCWLDRSIQHPDITPEVDCWVRNLLNRPQHSFSLVVSTGRFYPDFVCKLKDGRYLVVEYKGGHLYTDAEEKRTIGEVWEKRSSGRCLFVMPTGSNNDPIRAKIRANEGPALPHQLGYTPGIEQLQM